MKQLGFIIGVGFFIICSSVARDFAELESTYLGEGWFQYRFKSLVDPYFESVDIGDLYLTTFTNRIEYGPAPANCTNDLDVEVNTAEFHYDRTLPQERPYEKTFLVRSSERHFKRHFGALFTMSLTLHEFINPYTSINIVGYATMTNLVPCSAEEADGSPTNLITKIELVRDPKIDELIMVGNSARGLKYSWVAPSTVRLEASRDMSSWTNVAYIYGSEGMTTWTTNQSLNSYGHVFRLALLASKHLTNLPPLNESAALLFTGNKVSNSSAKVLSCHPFNNGLETTISTQPGLKYKVDLVRINGDTFVSQIVTAIGKQEKVQFISSTLPNAVYVQATLLP